MQARRESQTWDEGCHILAGYSYWTRGDFGVNREHPPLVKLLASFPLLGNDEARQEYRHAITMAQTVEPAFQKGWIPYVQGLLASK